MKPKARPWFWITWPSFQFVVFYIFSFGPVSALTIRGYLPVRAVKFVINGFYFLIAGLAAFGPEPLRSFLNGWTGVWLELIPPNPWVRWGY